LNPIVIEPLAWKEKVKNFLHVINMNLNLLSAT